LVMRALDEIRRPLRFDIGVGEPEANFIHSSDLKHRPQIVKILFFQYKIF
jgi:hypothetical protein